MAILINPDGIEPMHQDIEPKGDEFTLAELYKLIECRVVTITGFESEAFDRDHIMICDDEALLVRKPKPNTPASRLAGQPIYGKVIICRRSEFK
jgi:hypothetical protein